MKSVKGKYEFLEHTADVKFLAYGKNLEEAFSNAALATFSIMTDISKVKEKIKKEIKIHATKKESLLYDFLEQLVFLMDTEGFILSKVKELIITEKNKIYELKSVIVGDKADHYDVHTAIKAVTYNDMFIKEAKGRVIIQVVHDI